RLSEQNRRATEQRDHLPFGDKPSCGFQGISRPN
ncbi:hypothetical protein TIFTF001_040911, partial [Ficus carica]